MKSLLLVKKKNHFLYIYIYIYIYIIIIIIIVSRCEPTAGYRPPSNHANQLDLKQSFSS
ncbi:hypothetical protein K7X86_00425 [Candidatus Sulcia muelleri]|nr:hypothetical protein [Candidatus Karelsulcia muelleri]